MTLQNPILVMVRFENKVEISLKKKKKKALDSVFSLSHVQCGSNFFLY